MLEVDSWISSSVSGTSGGIEYSYDVDAARAGGPTAHTGPAETTVPALRAMSDIAQIRFNSFVFNPSLISRKDFKLMNNAEKE